MKFGNAGIDAMWLGPQLAVVGAIAAAGIAIVAGLKDTRSEKEPERVLEKVQRKVNALPATSPGNSSSESPLPAPANSHKCKPCGAPWAEALSVF